MAWVKVLSGPLSPSTGYALSIDGPYGLREVRNLIRQLELQAEFLAQESAFMGGLAEIERECPADMGIAPPVQDRSI